MAAAVAAAFVMAVVVVAAAVAAAFVVAVVELAAAVAAALMAAVVVVAAALAAALVAAVVWVWAKRRMAALLSPFLPLLHRRAPLCRQSLPTAAAATAAAAARVFTPRLGKKESARAPPTGS